MTDLESKEEERDRELARKLSEIALESFDRVVAIDEKYKDVIDARIHKLGIDVEKDAPPPVTAQIVWKKED